MINFLQMAPATAKSPRFQPRRGGKQEERLYKQVNRRVTLR